MASKGGSESSPWDMHISELGLVAKISSVGLLVQGLGRVGEREFFFHAKHSEWSFEMADDLGGLPSDTGNLPVCILRTRYRFAGEMSLNEAKQIIESCARFYLAIVKAHL